MLKIGIFSLVMRVLGLLASFLIGIVLARALGPAEFGIYGLITTLAALAMTAGLLGTPQLAVRDLSVAASAQDHSAVAATLSRFGRATSMASIGIAAVIVLAGWWFTRNQPRISALILPAALLVPLTAWTTLIAAELRGLGSMLKGQSMETFARPAVAFLITASWVLAGIALEVGQALWIQVLVAGLAVLISWLWIRRAAPSLRSTPFSEGQPWLKAGLFLMAVDLLRVLGGTYGIVMMGWLDNDVALGMFRVAYACVMVAAMPVTILHVTLAPNLAQLYRENRRGELQRLLSLSSAAMVAMVAPIVAAAYFIGRPVIETVFGAEYGPAWLPLFYLCVAQLVYGLFGMAPILLSMCNAEGKLFTIYVIATIAGVVVAFPLILSHSATGAAVAMIISNALIGLLSWNVGRRSLGVDSTFLPMLRPSFWRQSGRAAPLV